MLKKTINKKCILLFFLLLMPSCKNNKKHEEILNLSYKNFALYNDNFYTPFKRSNDDRYLCLLNDKLNVQYFVYAPGISQKDFDDNHGEMKYPLFFNVGVVIQNDDEPNFVIYLNDISKYRQIDVSLMKYTIVQDHVSFFVNDIEYCHGSFSVTYSSIISDDYRKRVCEESINGFKEGFNYVF